MKHRTLYYLTTICGAALLASCSVKEPVLEPAGSEEIVPVSVSLNLSVAEEGNGTPGTRAIDDPVDEGAVSTPRLRTLCLLQYGGTGEDARLVGDVHYLEATGEEDLDLSALQLADSNGEEHTLVILANTFTRIPKVRTLGEMLDLTRFVAGEAELFGHDGQSEGAFTDTDYFQRMNALAVSVIEEGATLQGTLTRSMARINVNIENTGADGLRIQKVQLRSVSQKDYYITDYSYAGGTLRDTPFRDRYVVSEGYRTDYAVKTWADGGGSNDGTVSSGEGTGTATYRWYVPSNMRGTDAGTTRASEKNVSPNALGATYLYILGHYGADENGDGTPDNVIEYRFYLGENLTDNFDLKPNTSYTYDFTFNGKGKTVADKRITDYPRVDFTVDANCYIVNPAPEGEAPRIYTFNVVHRPNIFWGERYGLNTEYIDYTISQDEGWLARVLWSDVPYDVNAILTKKSGKGGLPADYMINSENGQRVELTIPSDIPEGNLVIAVSSTSAPDVALWSWHIWITRYQPDDIEGFPPVDGTYVYPVVDGEVHRYGGDIWTTGRYKDGYAMDRNLGALDDRYHGNARGGGFYYQFGRKDPFPAGHAIYSYASDGTMTTEPGDAIQNWKIASSGTGYNGKNVPYSVMNPRMYIGGYSWTSDDVFNPTTYNPNIVWQDPYNTLRMDNEEAGGNASKSFFDPCPPGWRLPVNGTWADFSGDDAGSSTTNQTVKFQWGVETFNGRNRGTGRTYYPLTFYASKSNPTDSSIPTIFFPASGNRFESSGAMQNVGSRGRYWSSSPSSVMNGFNLSFTLSAVSPWGINSRAFGFPVRCVRESYQ